MNTSWMRHEHYYPTKKNSIFNLCPTQPNRWKRKGCQTWYRLTHTTVCQEVKENISIDVFPFMQWRHDMGYHYLPTEKIRCYKFSGLINDKSINNAATSFNMHLQNNQPSCRLNHCNYYYCSISHPTWDTS